MLSRFFLLVSLLVFLSLMISGSAVEPALIKMGTVFFALAGGLIICRSLVSVIREEAKKDEHDAEADPAEQQPRHQPETA